MAEKTTIETIKEIFDDTRDPVRKIMERMWYRNILYYIGEQWIEWHVSLNSFRRIPMHPYIPTPVSNIIRDYVRSTKALILNKEFTVKVWPNSNELEDREAAVTGEKLLRWMDDDDEDFKEEKEKLIIWMLLTGTGLMRTIPIVDHSSFGIDKSGKINKKADVVCESVLPFNVYVDPLGDSLSKKRWVGIRSLKAKEWIEDAFNVEIEPEGDERAVNYQQRLMKLVANVSPWKSAGLESQMLDFKAEDLVVFKEVEFAPTKKYPKGRYVAAVGDKVLIDAKNLPIPPEDGKWYYTLEDFHYSYVPGRFWSDAGVNDIISPQNSINQIDQALELNRKGLGRPLVLLEGGIDIKRVSKWGQALLVLSYDRNLFQRPIIESGTPLPDQVLKERDIHKTSAQDAAGDPKHVLRGQAPTSGASGILVDILRESAEQGHLPDLMRFYRSMKKVYRKRLILAKNIMTSRRMIKISGKGTDIEIVAFKGSDLRNNTDVRLELDSGISTTRAGQSKMIMDLIPTGLFGDLTMDPETRQDILRRIGLAGFKHKTNVDVERAEQENLKIMNDTIEGIFIAMPTEEGGEEKVVNDDPLFKYDDHAIHYEVHRRFILSKEFKTLPERATVVLIAHTDLHHKLMMAQMQQAMMAEQEAEEAGGGQGGRAAEQPPPTGGITTP